jgi:DNA-binding NtrC family response regulator
MIQWNPLMTMKEVEREVIRQALAHHGGILAHAAEDLDLGRSTLYSKLETLFTKEEVAVLRTRRPWWQK